MKASYRLLLTAWYALLLSVLVQFAVPFIGGIYYSLCGDHKDEQAYLDICIRHLKDMRVYCDDSDLQGILDYTIQRYNKIGAWDVMIFPLACSPKAVGCNEPFCPGITLDPSLLLWEPEDTAIIIAHEAMHDYWPYYGHSHINQREEKLWKLSTYVIRRLHRSNLRRLPCD